MEPAIKSLLNYSEAVESVVGVTAKHREMLDQALQTFGIVPDYDLKMRHLF